MKTQIIKVKDYELVNLCDMTFQEFMALCSCIEASKASNCQRVRNLVNELHVTTHWITDWQNRTVSLCLLKWDDVMILAAILTDEAERLKACPMNHWYKDTAEFKISHIAKILEALNVTFEARIEE